VWGEIESTWYVGHYLAYCVEQSMEWELAGETEVAGENLPSGTFSTTYPTWPVLGSNPGRHGGKPATNRLSYDTAYRVLYLHSLGVQAVAYSLYRLSYRGLMSNN
jgi:hypothetical protein